MEWTTELNDLLNQCVFECGYEFTDACRLLQSRARTLRLIAEGECALTADLCQVQWMAINPMDEDDGYDHHGEYDHDRHHSTPSNNDSELHFHQQMLKMDFLGEAMATVSSSSGRSSPLQHEPAEYLVEDQVGRVENVGREENPSGSARVDASAGVAAYGSASPQMSSGSYPMYECAPLLELSISEAELDLLISSLPEAQPEDGNNGNGDSSADAKHAGRSSGGSSSEMQWVLSFLTNPDDAAQHDAEAKSLLESLERHDDDNYQYFLQELNQANLLLAGTGSSEQGGISDSSLHIAKQETPSDPNSLDSSATQALVRLKLRAKAQEEYHHTETTDAFHCSDVPIGEDDDDASDDESDDDDDDDEDWEIVRRSMKTQATRQVITSSSSHIVSSASSSHANISIHESRITNSRLVPPPAPFSLSRGAGSENSNDANSRDHYSQKNHRVALSQEIGDLLKTHGEFQFPKHMFPHHNDALEVEQ